MKKQSVKKSIRQQKQCFLLSAVLFLSSIGIFATPPYYGSYFSVEKEIQQQKTVTGLVTDEKGEPLPGVSIVLKNNPSKGTTTDLEGNYTLSSVLPSDVLVFTYIGFTKEEITVGNKRIINLIMKEEAHQLEDVVVVGYGQQEKQKVVSSISAVEGKAIELPARNLSGNLSGRVAGLISVQRSGEPGYDNSEIYIRGISSFAGGTGALVLVDGVPRSINDISPEEVETFTILKDASATAVYGAEGANGVILITSKRGRSQKTNIDIRIDHIINQPTRIVKFLGAPDWMRLYNEAKWNTAGNPEPSYWGSGGYIPEYTDEIIAKHASGEDLDLYPNTDWMSMLKPYAKNLRAALNFRGGGDKLRFFVATSFFNEEGLFRSNPVDAKEYQKDVTYDVNIGLQRFNLRSNIDMDITESTKLKVDLSGQYLTTNYPGTGTGTIFQQMMRSAPHLIPMIYSNGYPSRYSNQGGFENPYTSLNFRGYAREYRVRLQSNVGFEQRLDFITKGLYAKGSVSFDADFDSKINRVRNPSEYFQNGRDADGNLRLRRVVAGQSTPTEAAGGAFSAGNKRIYIETSLNYNRSLGYHSIGGLLLYNQKESQLQGNPYLYKKQNVVGRASYAYNNKYFMDASFGFTGSENFAPENRFGFFPAVGLGYMLTNEAVVGDWLKKNHINRLKLRLSYGRTGNDQVGGDRFPYRERLEWSSTNFNLGMGNNPETTGRLLYERQLYNPNLRWEIEEKRNIGLDITLFKSLDLTIDYFNNERTDILIRRNTVSGISGFQQNPFENYGIVKNEGIDASLNFKTNFDKFTVSAMGTFTFARNKIIERDEVQRLYDYQMSTGHSINIVDAYVAERLYQESDFDVTIGTRGERIYQLKSGIPVPNWGNVYPGNIKYADLNGDGVVDGNDWTRKPTGAYPSTPEINYGLGFTIDYAGFYVSSFFQGVANVTTYLRPAEMLPFLGTQPLTTSTKAFAMSRWTYDNPSQDVVLPRLMLNNANQNDQLQSTWWMRNGSFLRFKNFEIGYRFKKETLEKIKMKALRVYVLGQNIMTWDNIKYWDPEQGGSTGSLNYPLQRSYNIGLDLTL